MWKNILIKVTRNRNRINFIFKNLRIKFSEYKDHNKITAFKLHEDKKKFFNISEIKNSKENINFRPIITILFGVTPIVELLSNSTSVSEPKSISGCTIISDHKKGINETYLLFAVASIITGLAMLAFPRAVWIVRAKAMNKGWQTHFIRFSCAFISGILSILVDFHGKMHDTKVMLWIIHNCCVGWFLSPLLVWGGNIAKISTLCCTWGMFGLAVAATLLSDDRDCFYEGGLGFIIFSCMAYPIASRIFRMDDATMILLSKNVLIALIIMLSYLFVWDSTRIIDNVRKNRSFNPMYNDKFDPINNYMGIYYEIAQTVFVELMKMKESIVEFIKYLTT